MSSTVSAPSLPDEARATPKRLAVHEAARTLFLARGYGAVSMDAVAKAAGVSKATLYAYFPSKEALFADIIGTGNVRLEAAIEDAADHHELPIREALVAILTRWLDFSLGPNRVAMRRVVVAEGVRFPALARAFYESSPERLQAWMTAWIEEEQRRGRLRADAEPALAAAQFRALLRGELMYRREFGLDPDPVTEAMIAKTARETAETFLRAYGA